MLNRSSRESPVDSLEPSRRPWYMKGGTRRPYPAIKARSTGRRLAQLWPEENAYDDRVTNQVNVLIVQVHAKYEREFNRL